ncbi:MAG: glycosyltransferase [Candidatus Firestonebacteria bacterium]
MKILLVAPSEGILGHIADWTKDAFISYNHDVRSFDYRKSPHSFLTRIADRLSIMKDLKAKKMNSDLLREINNYNPDYILVFLGENIHSSTLMDIKEKSNATLINWFHDTVVSKYRNKFLQEYPKYYDFFFIIDSLKALKEINITADNFQTLVMACDENVHKKININEEDKTKYKSKVSFIGTVVPQRVKVLEHIADLDLSIWGSKYNIFGNWIKEFPVLAKSYRRGPFKEYSEVVKIINSSDIIVNIHGFTGEKHFDMPSRTFEVAGCGTFQLTEYTESISEYFEIGKEIICFKTKEELRDLIKYYLSQTKEREEIAKNAQKRTYKDHTFKQRIKKMLEIIKNEKQKM